MVQAVRGMRDVLPKEARRWSLVADVISNVLKHYTYEEVQLPLLEYTELFARGVGESTDIVEIFMVEGLSRQTELCQIHFIYKNTSRNDSFEHRPVSFRQSTAVLAFFNFRLSNILRRPFTSSSVLLLFVSLVHLLFELTLHVLFYASPQLCHCFLFQCVLLYVPRSAERVADKPRRDTTVRARDFPFLSQPFITHLIFFLLFNLSVFSSFLLRSFLRLFDFPLVRF